MDLPNLTLFVQMGNFVVAYLVLRRYVFVPAYNIILAQQSRLESLNQKIDTAYVQQQQIVHQQKNRRAFMKDSLKQAIPDFSVKLCQSDLPQGSTSLMQPVEAKDVMLSDQQKKELSVMLQDALSDVKL
jgi:hypothetical protein